MNGRLIARRKERNFTQEQVAQALGITVRQYQRYEAGTVEPRISTAMALALTLQCEITDIFQVYLPCVKDENE